MTQRPIPVHIGSETPSAWDETEARQREAGENASTWLRDKRRPRLACHDLDWQRMGLEPRWVGFDTADCAVAIEPSVYHGQGADEFDRFRDGAANRGETALVISPIGGEQERHSPLALFRNDASVSLGKIHSSVIGHQLGVGATVRMADDVEDADRQLALRLLSLNPAPRWFCLTLEGQTLMQPGGPTWEYPPEGELIPIIETELGEPVVAAWVSPDEVERRYVVPAETPWPQLLDWLIEQALPEFVPGAMRRARRELGTDPALMTRREREARAAIATLELDYQTRKAALAEELAAAEAAATSVREGLLYGTGAQLVTAVRAVLESADITVIDVDELLGDTKNADLVCTYGGHSRLVEVKSAGGNAPERAYEDLMRHLREWPHLSASPHVDGGALIINHQVRTVPQDRRAQPYARPEFLAAQSEPVVTSLGLLEAWREEDWGTVRRLLFGELQSAETGSSELSAATIVPSAPASRRNWFARRP